MSMRVAIAGGGLAGLTCAKYLVDAGCDVQLYEGMPFLGGRASTYRDPDGEWVEQGLHLFLGTYSEFKALLRSIGQAPDEVLCWMDEIRFQDPEGPQARFGINPFSNPVKTALSFLGQNDYLDPLDKISLLPLVAPALLDFDYLQREHDDKTVTDWWRRLGGTPNVLERYLRPFCRAIQFTDPDDFSAFNFLGWVHHTAYDLAHAYAGGYRGPRDETIFKPLASYLEQRGALLRTGVRLEGVDFDVARGRVAAFHLSDGNRITADAFVLALPAWSVAPILPPALREDPFFSKIASLPISPAISVQLWFDGSVIDSADYTLVARSIASVYQDQSTNAYPDPRGSRVSIIVSPADDWLDLDDAEILDEVLRVLEQVQPPVRGATLRKSVVLKHRSHLIRPLPGAMSQRPTQHTPVPNLFLAGDWTQQDYFGSQEGAVRSGKSCADTLLARWLDVSS